MLRFCSGYFHLCWGYILMHNSRLIEMEYYSYFESPPSYLCGIAALIFLPVLFSLATSSP